MGSHTRVAPWGKTISTRVVTSKPRHFSVGRGSNALCANESPGNVAAAGRIAPVFRKARLSMSVLLSIERRLTSQAGASQREARGMLAGGCCQKGRGAGGEEGQGGGAAGRTAAG